MNFHATIGTELQRNDMELAVSTEPGSLNMGIPHVGAPPLGGGIRKMVISARKIQIGIPVVRKVRGPDITATGDDGLAGLINSVE